MCKKRLWPINLRKLINNLRDLKFLEKAETDQKYEETDLKFEENYQKLRDLKFWIKK